MLAALEKQRPFDRRTRHCRPPWNPRIGFLSRVAACQQRSAAEFWAVMKACGASTWCRLSTERLLELDSEPRRRHRAGSPLLAMSSGHCESDRPSDECPAEE